MDKEGDRERKAGGGKREGMVKRGLAKEGVRERDRERQERGGGGCWPLGNSRVSIENNAAFKIYTVETT